jgi:hypothetical protein
VTKSFWIIHGWIDQIKLKLFDKRAWKCIISNMLIKLCARIGWHNHWEFLS